MKKIVSIIILLIILLSTILPTAVLAEGEITDINKENKVVEKDEKIEEKESNKVNADKDKVDDKDVANEGTGNNTENSNSKMEQNIEENKDTKKETNENIIVQNSDLLDNDNSDKLQQEIQESPNAEDIKIKYYSHIEQNGWEKEYAKSDGETSGTVGESKRVEAIKIALGNSKEVPEGASIKYQVHVQDYGWMNWKQEGEIAGTIGESKRIEAIRIELTGLEGYTVLYRTHVQDIGWTQWSNNGEISGTEGKSKRIEAIQIKIVKIPKIEIKYTYNKNKNTVTAEIISDKKLSYINDSSWTLSNDKLCYTKEYDINGNYDVQVKDIEGVKSKLQVKITQVVEPISMVKYSSHIQKNGWEKNYSKIDGATSGTSGQGKRLEAIKIALGNSEEIPEGASIKYQVHVQDYGWMNWKQNGEIAGTIGESKRIEAIRIGLTGLEGYTVSYRTHVQDIGWTQWSNNGEISGTEGKSKRIEAIQIKILKNPKIEIKYTYNNNENTVTAEIISDKKLNYINDNSWSLSDDKLCYTKKYDVNDNYDVIIRDIDGIQKKLQIKITQVVEPISMVKYSSHIQTNGWEKKYSKIDGDVSGTTGQEKRLEAIRISLGNSEEIPKGANIKYQVHVQNYGWMNWKQNGEIAGTEGESKRIEAIKIKIEGMEEYCVEYRTHIEDSGWQKWKSDGEISGTISEGKRLEAIQIRIVKKENKTIEPRVEYQAYVQKNGWQGKVTENTIAGTTGQSKGIEALKIDLKGANQKGSIKYRSYVSNSWQDWVNGNEVTGTEGKSKNIEAIQIELENLEGYSVEYRAYISEYGWQKWRKNGEIAGSINTGNKIEAIQIRIVYNTSETIEPEVSYQAYVQEDGWHEQTAEGFVAGTEGQSKRIEALKINLLDNKEGIILKYRTHIQEIGWQAWGGNGSVAGTTGQSKRMEAIQIKLEGTSKYTVEYKVHIQDYGWSDWMIDGETAGTIGQSKRIEAIRIRIVPKYYRRYRGIDVSEHNGVIDWQSVKNSGVQFAMIRCAYRGYRTGIIVTDSKFDYNMQNALNAGIKVGVYFFSQAVSISEAAEEANYAVNLAKKYNVTYPIAIDSESSGADNNDGRADGIGTALRTNVMAAFCNQIQNYGYVPMIYASRDWFYNNLEVNRLSGYETWLAHYTGNSLVPSNYKYGYTMWQYTSSGSVPGINSRVDLNIGYKKY